MLEILQLLRVRAFLQAGGVVIGLERFVNVFGFVDEIEDERILLASLSSVKSRKCLDGLHAVEAFIHVHGV